MRDICDVSIKIILQIAHSYLSGIVTKALLKSIY
jgi:hypothetical protein